MGFIQRVFGDSHASTPLSQPPDTVRNPAPGAPSGLRRELLRVALRDTLVRHGIPAAWLSAETVPEPGSAAGLEQRLHLRLLIRHHDPRLLAHGMALQSSLCKRVELFDPLASQWLAGISWQFAVAQPPAGLEMPDPAEWAPAAAPSQRPPPHKGDADFAVTQQSPM